MEKDYFRYYKPKMLLTTIVVLSLIYGTLLHFASDYINSFLINPYVHYPTVSTLIVLTLLLIDKIGLRTPLLKEMFWVKDISGRYEGKIKYKNFKTGIEEYKSCFLEIEQTASKFQYKPILTLNTFNYQKRQHQRVW